MREFRLEMRKRNKLVPLSGQVLLLFAPAFLYALRQRLFVGSTLGIPPEFDRHGKRKGRKAACSCGGQTELLCEKASEQQD